MAAFNNKGVGATNKSQPCGMPLPLTPAASVSAVDDDDAEACQLPPWLAERHIDALVEMTLSMGASLHHQAAADAAAMSVSAEEGAAQGPSPGGPHHQQQRRHHVLPDSIMEVDALVPAPPPPPPVASPGRGRGVLPTNMAYTLQSLPTALFSGEGPHTHTRVQPQSQPSSFTREFQLQQHPSAAAVLARAQEVLHGPRLLDMPPAPSFTPTLGGSGAPSGAGLGGAGPLSSAREEARAAFELARRQLLLSTQRYADVFTHDDLLEQLIRERGLDSVQQKGATADNATADSEAAATMSMAAELDDVLQLRMGLGRIMAAAANMVLTLAGDDHDGNGSASPRHNQQNQPQPPLPTTTAAGPGPAPAPALGAAPPEHHHATQLQQRECERLLPWLVAVMDDVQRAQVVATARVQGVLMRCAGLGAEWRRVEADAPTCDM